MRQIVLPNGEKVNAPDIFPPGFVVRKTLKQIKYENGIWNIYYEIIRVYPKQEEDVDTPIIVE